MNPGNGLHRRRLAFQRRGSGRLIWPVASGQPNGCGKQDELSASHVHHPSSYAKIRRRSQFINTVFERGDQRDQPKEKLFQTVFPRPAPPAWLQPGVNENEPPQFLEQCQNSVAIREQDRAELRANIVDCGSPLPLLKTQARESGSGLPQFKTSRNSFAGFQMTLQFY